MQSQTLIRGAITDTLEYFNGQNELIYIPSEIVQSAENPTIQAMLDELTPDEKPFIKDYHPNPNVDGWIVYFADESQASITCIWTCPEYRDLSLIKIEVSEQHRSDQWIASLVERLMDIKQKRNVSTPSVSISVFTAKGGAAPS